MRYKNIILFSVFLIGQIPTIFFGTAKRMNLAFFVERSTRLDFWTMYYANAFSFLILAHLIKYPKGVDKRIARFILIVCYLDIIHLVFFAKQGFGMAKIGAAIALFYIYALYKKSNDQN